MLITYFERLLKFFKHTNKREKTMFDDLKTRVGHSYLQYIC